MRSIPSVNKSSHTPIAWIFMILLLCTTLIGIAQAQPFIDDGQVNLFPRGSGPDRSAPFNLYNEYPGTINWYMPPSNRNMSLIGADNSILNIDFHAHVANGLGVWARASGIRFNEVSRQGDANIIFNIQDRDDLYAASTGVFARTTPYSSSGTPSTIAFFRRSWQDLYPHGDFLIEVQGYMARGTSEAEAMNFIAARTAMHEIGHALGFMHPGVLMRQDISGNPNAIIMLENYSSPSPAIMEPSQYGFEELYEANERRPISVVNLGISTQERAVLSALNANRVQTGRLTNMVATLAIVRSLFHRGK